MRRATDATTCAATRRGKCTTDFERDATIRPQAAGPLRRRRCRGTRRSESPEAFGRNPDEKLPRSSGWRRCRRDQQPRSGWKRPRAHSQSRAASLTQTSPTRTPGCSPGFKSTVLALPTGLPSESKNCTTTGQAAGVVAASGISTFDTTARRFCPSPKLTAANRSPPLTGNRFRSACGGGEFRARHRIDTGGRVSQRDILILFRGHEHGSGGGHSQSREQDGLHGLLLIVNRKPPWPHYAPGGRYVPGVGGVYPALRSRSAKAREDGRGT